MERTQAKPPLKTPKKAVKKPKAKTPVAKKTREKTAKLINKNLDEVPKKQPDAKTKLYNFYENYQMSNNANATGERGQQQKPSLEALKAMLINGFAAKHLSQLQKKLISNEKSEMSEVKLNEGGDATHVKRKPGAPKISVTKARKVSTLEAEIPLTKPKEKKKKTKKVKGM